MPLTFTHVVGLAGLIALTTPACADFITLGKPEGTRATSVRRLSYDGSVAIGATGVSIAGQPESFSWTHVTGRVDVLAPSGGTYLDLSAVTDTSQVVYGRENFSTAPRAKILRRSALGGEWETVFVAQGNSNPELRDVSGDGNILIGNVNNAGNSLPYRWTTQTGMVTLPIPYAGDDGALAYAASADASVIIGNSYYLDGNDNRITRASRWLADGTVQQLPSLPGSFYQEPQAYEVSADGRYTVGSSDNSNGELVPVRWLENNTPEYLGLLPGFAYGSGRSASQDGSLIVGICNSFGLRLAFAWTEETGILPLAQFLAGNGVTVPGGTILEEAWAVSADGTTVGGTALLANGSREGFIARIPTPSTLAALGLLMLTPRRRQM
jgi:uncharacterized membrane protein